MSKFGVWLRRLALFLFAAALVAAGALWAAYVWADRTPGELLRYAERRLIGHPKLEFVLLPPMHWLQDRVERTVVGLDPPGAWRGASPEPLPPVSYDSQGRPREASPSSSPASRAVVRAVGSAQDLVHAFRAARAGDRIEILPGRYRIAATSLATQSGGSAGAPIAVRAARLGEVVLEFDLLEGFHVKHPYWVFENLEIAGVCPQDSDCEHAFHVVGDARSTVIRNNRLRDFNAQIKVNGVNGAYPDFGLIQANSIFNTRPRDTGNPVTTIDIVGASGWQIVDNFIADFVKLGGNQISYGAFMKGAGSSGRMERNIVICALALQRQPGLRVGLSFGGGTTGEESCRDGRCDAEYSDGLAANNIVAHCNDFGIDVNRSRGITLVHNTLINTAGIDIREHPASAVVSNNLLEGRIRHRKGGWAVESNNWTGMAWSLFDDADHLQLHPPSALPAVPAVPVAAADLCGNARGRETVPGALSGAPSCLHQKPR